MRGQVLPAVLGRARPPARVSAGVVGLLVAACAVAPAEPPAPEPDWRAAVAAAESRGDAPALLAALRRGSGTEEAAQDADFWRRLLAAAEAAGDGAWRIEARARLLALRPEDAELRRAQAADLLRSGAPDLALACLDAAPSPMQDTAGRVLHAEAQAALGRHAEAAREFEAAAAEATTDAGRLWARASSAWERAGARDAATRAIERALAGVELDPREHAALSRLRAFELGEIGSASDARAVLRLHDDADLRLAAARYLAGAEFPDAVATFGAATADPDARVRRVCLRALAERCGPLERAYLVARCVERVPDEDLEVRIAALDALASAGSRAEIPLLLEALDPADRAQFRAARRALEQICGPVVPGPRDPDAEQRGALREAWRAWWRGQGGA